MTDLIRTSPIKLGLAVAWPTFWTGVPLKIVLVLLFLAAGLHPWELPAVAFLLLLSIPIDMWALGVTSRSVFLERLRREPPEGLGLTLWWQITLLSAVYLPIAYVLQSQTVAWAKTLVSHTMDQFKAVPVAERIGIELVLWGSVATVLLIVLSLGWLYGIGVIVRRQAVSAPSVTAPYPHLVKRWDLMRIPADQTLVLTVLVASGVVLVMLFWAFMPVTTPHPHEEYKKAIGTAKAAKPLKPTEVLQKTETVIAQAEASVQALEAKGHPKDKTRAKAGDAKDARKVAPKSPAQAGTVKSPPAAAKGQAHDDHDSTPHSH